MRPGRAVLYPGRTARESLLRTALIGHTGFVGSHLLRAMDGADCFNSSNIEQIAGRSYDLVVCAGVSAVKWLANREPEKDWAGIERLIGALRSVRASEFVLISTVDVYPSPLGVDETLDLANLDNHPYGRHRLALECAVRGMFDTVRIVRLPALFGDGLKKNVIYDLLVGNGLDAINPASSFQWYSLDWLWNDLSWIRGHDLRLVNLVTEPVGTAEIITKCFNGGAVGAKSPAARYDLRTIHAPVFPEGTRSGYVLNRDGVLSALDRYVAAARRRGTP